MGKTLVERGIHIIYGGGKYGLMGILADSVLECGGTIQGIITRQLEGLEVAHEKLTKLDITETMSERKTLLMEAADGFLVLPGGLGTLEELSEVLSLAALGLLHKPIGFFNVNHHFDGLFLYLYHLASRTFVSKEVLDRILLIDDDFHVLLGKMNVAYRSSVHFSMEEKVSFAKINS